MVVRESMWMDEDWRGCERNGLRVQRMSVVLSKGILCIDVESARDDLLAKSKLLITIQNIQCP